MKCYKKTGDIFCSPGGFNVGWKSHVDILDILPHLNDGLLVLRTGGVVDTTCPAPQVSLGHLSDGQGTRSARVKERFLLNFIPLVTI